MAIAKKGSRCIDVEGILYRWVVSPDDGYMVLLVELVSEPGQRLEACFPYHNLFDPPEAGAFKVVVSPRVVRKIILAALVNGWQPLQRGLRSFQVQNADQIVQIDG